ncbi:MAG TPA: helix-turn-helix domain-containing protein, partial [Candidatus Limnocylindrales bacterium]|nr:helix-turn-helix domain-containing protein [Candidatus Limnocylindrales bacterium]
MTIHAGRTQRARRQAATQLLTVGTELLTARELAGLSRHDVMGATGVSESAIRRMERGDVASLTMERLYLVADAVGLRPSLKLYPTGAPLRDAGHVALLERLRERLHSSLVWRTEVPLRGEGELRAWDAVIRALREWIPVDAETRLGDLQALERRTNLKMRDGGSTRVILLVADTRTNRAALRGAPGAWRVAFP